MNQQALDKLTKARTGLLIDQPFFGTLAMRLKMIEDTTVPTLAVNGKVMKYNPEFVNQQSNDLMKSAVAHEVLHCVLEHVGPHGRGMTLNPEKWNWAADYATNEILKESGFTLGADWLHNPAFKDMTAEHIYSLIPDPPPNGGGGGGSGNGQGQKPLDQIEPGDPDPAMAATDAAEWKVATVQAANAAKAVGKLSESLERFVEQQKQNKVDWRAVLRSFVTQAAKDDYAWSRPNRKMMAHGYCLPGLHSERMGKVYVGSDESGSVDDAIVSAFSAEVAAIKEDLSPEEVVLFHHSVEVGKVEHFGPDDPFVLKRYCYGGTSFIPTIEAMQAMPEPPVCAVMLTDLYGPFPPSPPDFPVLWVTINKEVAPWGDTLHIDV